MLVDEPAGGDVGVGLCADALTQVGFGQPVEAGQQLSAGAVEQPRLAVGDAAAVRSQAGVDSGHPTGGVLQELDVRAAPVVVARQERRQPHVQPTQEVQVVGQRPAGAEVVALRRQVEEGPGGLAGHHRQVDVRAVLQPLLQ